MSKIEITVEIAKVASFGLFNSSQTSRNAYIPKGSLKNRGGSYPFFEDTLVYVQNEKTRIEKRIYKKLLR